MLLHLLRLLPGPWTHRYTYFEMNASWRGTATLSSGRVNATKSEIFLCRIFTCAHTTNDHRASDGRWPRQKSVYTYVNRYMYVISRKVFVFHRLNMATSRKDEELIAQKSISIDRCLLLNYDRFKHGAFEKCCRIFLQFDIFHSIIQEYK